MQRWFESRAVDGYLIQPPILPAGLEEFNSRIIPELQNRGLFRTEYTRRTLPENLGLKRPPSMYAAEISSPRRATVGDSAVNMAPLHDADPALEPLLFRKCLGQFATGVAVVTACVGGELVGLTVNSFSSVSLTPPLILWSIGESSNSCPKFSIAGAYRTKASPESALAALELRARWAARAAKIALD
jgi:hypothetical protein